MTRRPVAQMLGALMCSALFLGGCSLVGSDTATNETPPPSASSGRIVDSSLQTPDGLTRTYRLVIPASLNSPSPAPVPLLIAMHGGVGSNTQFEKNSGFDVIAAQHQFIVAYPNGIGAAGSDYIRTWNGGTCCGPASRDNVDDVRFISQLIDTVESQFPVDRHRVFAAGHSNGGIMAYRLACELANKVVAIGLQAGTLMIGNCHPALPVSVIDIQGSGDKNVPIGGGVGPNGISGADFLAPITAVKTLAAANGCPARSTTNTDSTNSDVVTQTWQPCKARSAAKYVVVAGASHAWMGHDGGAPALTGEPYLKFDSTEAIWDFLSTHPRP